MSKINKSPDVIWNEYTKLTDYLTSKDIFSIVKRNEEFYDGRQWGNVGGNIAKPTMNRLQRIGKYQISMLSSNDVGISIKYPFGTDETNKMLDLVSNEIKDVIEQDKLMEKARLMVRDAFVDGSSYMMQSFNHDYETGMLSKGKIDCELVEMTRVLFGNPYSPDIQGQPYIIIVMRQYIDQVREEYLENNLGGFEDDIQAVSDPNYDDDNDGKLVTVLLTFYKKKHKETIEKVVADEFGNEVTIYEEIEKKTVFFTKTTQNITIIPETDLEYTRYPISRFGWDNIKNSYLFDSPMTANIDNQIFVNKMFFYTHEFAKNSAIPKTLVDLSKIDSKNLDKQKIGVGNLELLGKFMDYSKAPDFSPQIIQLIEKTEDEMERNMGVNDAALGNVKPDNTSAIIALQEAAGVPLEIQRQNFYEMWEDTIRNLFDIMTVCYGERPSLDKEEHVVMVNYSMLRGLNYKLNIDIGSSAQFSEIAQINTLNSLLAAGHIDLETFLEVCPDKYIPGKETIKKYAEEQKKLMEAMQNVSNVPMADTPALDVGLPQ